MGHAPHVRAGRRLRLCVGRRAGARRAGPVRLVLGGDHYTVSLPELELIGFDEEEFCVEHGFDEGIDRQCIVLGSQISVEDQHA